LRLGSDASLAAQALRPLFAQAAQSEEWGSVLLAGPALLQRLAQAKWDDALSEAQVAMLASWASHAHAAARKGHGASGPDRPASILPTEHDRAAPATGARVLSAREFEVLGCLAAGDSNKVIARRLALSPHTVKRHISSILGKLDLASRGQAAAWFRDQH
jgi:LuxR family maltose regulon positive regulatory protein